MATTGGIGKVCGCRKRGTCIFPEERAVGTMLSRGIGVQPKPKCGHWLFMQGLEWQALVSLPVLGKLI